MAWKKINDTKLTAIANAIRGKTGKSDSLTLDAMPTEIADIETGVDTSADTVTADVLVEGYTAHDAAGNPVVGTNPYEKTATDTTVTAQADLIAQIQTALEGKAGGGGTILETCTVQINTNRGGIWFVSYQSVVDGELAYGIAGDGSTTVTVENVLCGGMLCFEMDGNTSGYIVDEVLSTSTGIENVVWSIGYGGQHSRLGFRIGLEAGEAGSINITTGSSGGY